MPKKESKKRKRFGDRVRDGDPFASTMGPRDAVDLFVPLCPTASCSSATASPEQTLRSVVRQLHQAGYVQCAVTHTVYGRPKEDIDAAESAIPAALLNKSPIPVLRRLHVVVETLTDLALFAGHQSSPIGPILNGYDIVSISPRNAATWEAACRTLVHRRRQNGGGGAGGTGVDIVSIDYYSSHAPLPFRLRHADVRQLAQNNLVLEVPYAPALIDAKARRNLMLICSDAVTGGGTTTRILLSSGPRLVNQQDVGPQALRRPGDLLNFAHVVLGLSAKKVRQALDGSFLSSPSKRRQEKARRQQRGDEDTFSSSSIIARPYVKVTDFEIINGKEGIDSKKCNNDDDDEATRSVVNRTKKARLDKQAVAALRCDSSSAAADDDDDDDGFIAM